MFFFPLFPIINMLRVLGLISYLNEVLIVWVSYWIFKIQYMAHSSLCWFLEWYVPGELGYVPV
jgi:hypothetical protein